MNGRKGEEMKKGLFILGVIVILLATCMDTHAETKYRYTTQKVKLSKDLTVKHNTKVLVIKQGKKYAKVEYKGEQYLVRKKYLCKWKSPKLYTRKQFKRRGRIRWRGWSWTWYTQRILPGRGLKIPGRHVDKQGFVCDKDGYIVLASSIGYRKCKKILPTPFGKYGKVYDTNGTWNYGWRDVYTNW